MQTPVRLNVILTSTGHMPTQPERSPDAQLRSRFLFGRGPTRALVNSAPPHAPIDDRDRVESGSPLPRRLTVAIP